MANQTCNNEPKDSGDEDRIMSRREQAIEEILLKSYAQEVHTAIDEIVSKRCFGCEVQHGSQNHHQCVMMEGDERILLYFDTALETISEAKVVERFMKNLKGLKPSINGLELLRYTCSDWRKLFCLCRRQRLKRETYLLYDY